MNYIHVIFLLVVPIAMFFGGFLVAGQLRALQNAPLISMMFVQRRWLLSTIIGIPVSGIFSLITFLDAGFSAWNILAFFVMALIASASYYLGMTVGWGRSLSTSASVATANQPRASALPDNVVVDDTLNSVLVTIHTRKRWGWFVMSLFQLAFIGLCVLPIVGLMAISMLQDYVPRHLSFLIWVLVGGLALYLVYRQFQEALEYVFDKETIEIDNVSVKIEKCGSGFNNRKEYSADNIKKITTLFSFGTTSAVTRRSPFVNSNVPAFAIWHHRGLRRYRSFGRAVDLADAQSILETIYRRFPQYKG